MTHHDSPSSLQGHAPTTAANVFRSEACYNEPLNDRIAPAHMTYARAVEFNLIREVDADILEQGVEEKRGVDWADFDDEGRRLEASGSNVSLAEFENENDAAAREEEMDDSSRSQRSSDGSIMGESIDESRNDVPPSSAAPSLASSAPLQTTSRKYTISISAASSNDNTSMPAIAEDVSCHIPHRSSDDSQNQNYGIDSEPLESLSENNDNDYFLGATSPQSPSRPEIQEIDHEALARRIASGRAHHRSDSFDRRMSESAQFAEAVGEEPNSLLLKKIIEEDSSSDFDDDEIDEGGVNLLLIEDSQVELLDYKDVVGTEEQQPPEVDDAAAQLAGESSEKIEPTCVSTDLAHVFLNGGDSNQPLSQQHQELLQLSTTLEAGGDSAPTTPAPSPCKPASMMPNNKRPSFTTSFHPPCYVDWKFTRSYSSGSNLDGNNARHKGGAPNNCSGESDFVYRGIRANPPEITKRGMARGNYAQLHRKAWLEVTDKHHRYGKNLRMYYKHWEALGHPYLMFFDWLDSKGEAMGNPLPNLPEIPRPVLDSDTVLYINNPVVSASYALDIVTNPANGSATILNQNGNPINTGKGGWIFVLRDHVLYGSQKVTAPASPTAKPRERFHHSSFFSGKAVASAGIFITDEQGRLTQLWPHSGHYRPGEAHMQRALFFFQQLGVELTTFAVDMQQIFKVSRKTSPKGGDAAGAGGDKGKGAKEKDKENNSTMDNGKHSNNGQGKQHVQMKKSKKTDSLQLMCGLEVASFLAHKALMIEKGVFHQIHKIRRIPKESRSSVRFVLDHVND